MREQKLISKKEANTCNGEGITLEYYLTCRESEEGNQMLYGILVNKCTAQRVESEVVDNISYQEPQVLDLLDTIIENTVTPVCLTEVLDDLMTVRMYS